MPHRAVSQSLRCLQLSDPKLNSQSSYFHFLMFAKVFVDFFLKISQFIPHIILCVVSHQKKFSESRFKFLSKDLNFLQSRVIDFSPPCSKTQRHTLSENKTLLWIEKFFTMPVQGLMWANMNLLILFSILFCLSVKKHFWLIFHIWTNCMKLRWKMWQAR